MERSVQRGIENLIQTIARQTEEEISVLFAEDEPMAYDWENNAVIIGYDLDDEQSTSAFLDHLRNTHKCNFARKFSARLWSVLHEVGHHFTQDDELYENDLEMRAILALVPTPTTDEGYRNIANMYFDLPSEYEATEWAINYVRNNYTECQQFDQKLKGDI